MRGNAAGQARGDAIAVTKDGRVPRKGSYRKNFVTIAKKLHIRPKGTGERGKRTGVSPHEAFRDVVRSLLQTATRKSFDPLCAEFWMGHRVDPYNYNKFSELEPDYAREREDRRRIPQHTQRTRPG